MLGPGGVHPDPLVTLRSVVPQPTLSYVANIATRIFLLRVGQRYDRMRGLEPYREDRDIAVVVADFEGRCCFCETLLGPANTTDDHLTPTNQTSLGLTAWGNVVPACTDCNKRKHFQEWRPYLRSISTSDADFTRRVAKIDAFQMKYRYAPGVGLELAAKELYREVVTQTDALINAKIDSAEELISRLGGAAPP